jgi:hypothetical protein
MENKEAPSIQVFSDIHLEMRRGKQPKCHPLAKYAALLGLKNHFLLLFIVR